MNKAFFINGGAGRTLCSVPALENYANDNPHDDFIIVCEGGTDFYKGHPKLHFRAYDVWHKNLFNEYLKDRQLITPEPYRVWEYYNQQCNIAQAYDIEINGQGLRTFNKPKIYLSKEELIMARQMIKEIKDTTKKEKIVVFQPFGRVSKKDNDSFIDVSGRSFELENIVSIIRQLGKQHAVMLMSEFPIDLNKYQINFPVAVPQNIHVRIWSAVIKMCDHFLGCDSLGQHLANAFDKTATVVFGSTFPQNVSYPDNNKFDIIDMNKDSRIYSPIRITMDEYADRANEDAMQMDTEIENRIVQSVNSMIKHGYKKNKK